MCLIGWKGQKKCILTQAGVPVEGHCFILLAQLVDKIMSQVNLPSVIVSMVTSSVFQSRREPIKMARIKHAVLIRSSVWPMGHAKTWLNVAADTKNNDEILISSTLGHTLSLQSHQTVNLMSIFAGSWPAARVRRVSAWTTDLLMLFVSAVFPLTAW